MVQSRKKNLECGKHLDVPRGTENQHSPEGRKVTEPKMQEDLQVVLTMLAQTRAIPNIQKTKKCHEAFTSVSEESERQADKQLLDLKNPTRLTWTKYGLVIPKNISEEQSLQR